MEQLEQTIPDEPPVWAIFGDLMAGLVGVFVLLLVWTLGIQVELAQSLETEIQKRQAEEQRRMALEEALADPLATGRVTLRDGLARVAGHDREDGAARHLEAVSDAFEHLGSLGHREPGPTPSTGVRRGDGRVDRDAVAFGGHAHRPGRRALHADDELLRRAPSGRTGAAGR